MGFFEKMKEGLARTRSQMSAIINTMIADFTEENEEIYDTLEEMLILSDAGMETTEEIIEHLREQVRLRGCRGEAQLRETLTEILTDAMEAGDTALKLDTRPSVILVVGVNGVGKTTTIGKLASRLTADGKRSCSAPGTPSAPPRRSSSPCGRSAPAVISSATRRAATLPPWCSTPSPPPRPGVRT